MTEPTDMWVGGRQIRWWDNPKDCTHTEEKFCPLCTDLTAAEAQTIREYLHRIDPKTIVDLDAP